MGRLNFVDSSNEVDARVYELLAQKFQLFEGVFGARDLEIKEIRRTAATSLTLDEKLHWQKHQRELETKRNKLRRELFDRQDQIEA